MRLFSLLFSFCLFSLYAEPIDTKLKAFSQRQERMHVDVYDFTGDYPELENIDIDARRKKKVELKLTGAYPVLESLVYEGGFGSLKGKLTGDFPQLKQVEILCGNAAMEFDLETTWHRSCHLTFKGAKEPIRLRLPKNVGIVAIVDGQVDTKVQKGPLKKKGWWHVTHRQYENDLVQTSPVVLTLHIQAAGALITFE